MKKYRFIIIGALFLLSYVLVHGTFAVTPTISPRPAAETSAIPAFPGAEGFGAQATGGRGGKILFVTNLSAKNIPGSLRNAIEETGPRIVVFKVGGTIDLNDPEITGNQQPLVIRNPHITIAGQTAPGDGILIKGAELSIATHNVIVRNIRVRVGDALNGPDPGIRDALNIATSRTGKDVYDVIVDHSSFSWAIDENVSFWVTQRRDGSWPELRDVTIQWSVTTEAFGASLHPQYDGGNPRGMGLLVGDHAQNISILNNLLANNGDRNPAVMGDTRSEFINNVVYNWRCSGGPYKFSDANKSDKQYGNVIGNYFKKTSKTCNNYQSVWINDVVAGSKLYQKNNLQDNTNGTKTAEVVSIRTSVPNVLMNTYALTSSGAKEKLAEQSYTDVLEYGGAIIPARDEVDLRAVQSTKNRELINGGKGAVDSQSEVGGWPVLNGAPYPTDTDNDGIPDLWEEQYGLDAANPADASLYSSNGYMWIEEYINSFYADIPGFEMNIVPATVITPTPTPTPLESIPPSITIIPPLTEVPEEDEEGSPETDLTVSPEPVCPKKNQGDANCDGSISLVDYELFRQAYLEEVSAANADFNEDGKVTLIDAEIWTSHYL